MKYLNPFKDVDVISSEFISSYDLEGGSCMKIPLYTKKQIEHEFYNYEYYKSELNEIKKDILDNGPLPPDGQPKGNQTSNPTEQKAIEIAESVSVLALEKTINTIDWTLRSLSYEHRKVFNEAYIKGRKDYQSIAVDLHISYETLNRRKSELIKVFGLKFGILKS